MHAPCSQCFDVFVVRSFTPSQSPVSRLTVVVERPSPVDEVVHEEADSEEHSTNAQINDKLPRSAWSERQLAELSIQPEILAQVGMSVDLLC